MGKKKFSEEVEDAAKKILKARKDKSTFLHLAYMFGGGGWLFVLPVIGGAYLGRYLDKRFGNDSISWTITFIIIGIAVGSFNIWYFFFRKSKPRKRSASFLKQYFQ